jgi:hypothetical protein
MGILVQLLVALVFWAYVALAITIDQRLRTARAHARGEVNFDEGKPGRYVFWGLMTGGLVLPFYFYASRKRVWALLLGTVVLAVVYVATLFTAGVAGVAVRMLVR